MESDLSIKDEIALLQTNIIENTINIDFEPAENTVGWSFDFETSKVLLDEIPILDTQITITYNYTKDNNDNNGNADDEE